MLRIRRGANSFATKDIDVARLRSIFIAVNDITPEVIDTLRKVDPKLHLIAGLNPKLPSQLCGWRRQGRVF